MVAWLGLAVAGWDAAAAMLSMNIRGLPAGRTPHSLQMPVSIAALYLARGVSRRDVRDGGVDGPRTTVPLSLVEHNRGPALLLGGIAVVHCTAVGGPFWSGGGIGAIGAESGRASATALGF